MEEISTAQFIETLINDGACDYGLNERNGIISQTIQGKNSRFKQIEVTEESIIAPLAAQYLSQLGHGDLIKVLFPELLRKKDVDKPTT